MRVPLQQPGQPIPWWIQRDEAVRKEAVAHALPDLYAALDEQRVEQAKGASSGGVGLVALLFGALGIAWKASR